jgi:hypothetical protein
MERDQRSCPRLNKASAEMTGSPAWSGQTCWARISSYFIIVGLFLNAISGRQSIDLWPVSVEYMRGGRQRGPRAAGRPPDDKRAFASQTR